MRKQRGRHLGSSEIWSDVLYIYGESNIYVIVYEYVCTIDKVNNLTHERLLTLRP